MLARLMSGIGLICLVAFAWALSENRKAISWRLVLWGIGLQVFFAVILLPTPLQTKLIAPIVHQIVRIISFGKMEVSGRLDELFFQAMRAVVQLLTDATLKGSQFVFGNLATDPSYGATVAFQVLPVIILVAALSAVGYHFGIIPRIVRGIARLMRKTLKTSGAETFGAALLIFLGIESLTAIRTYLKSMTKSELLTVMTAFMATIAGSVMVVYATLGAEPGHLLTASFMSAPAAIVIAKILVPETQLPVSASGKPITVEKESTNVIEAAGKGAMDGLNLALNVAAMLIAFLGMIYILDVLVGWTTRPILKFMLAPLARNWGSNLPEALHLKDIFGVLFAPFALLMGVPKADIIEVGKLLGTKTILNEFLAYVDLQNVRQSLHPRSYLLALYALCGFANPGSLGILIAGMTVLAPERSKDITRLGVLALVGGTLACFMTACIVGVLLYE